MPGLNRSQQTNSMPTPPDARHERTSSNPALAPRPDPCHKATARIGAVNLDAAWLYRRRHSEADSRGQGPKSQPPGASFTTPGFWIAAVHTSGLFCGDGIFCYA